MKIYGRGLFRAPGTSRPVWDFAEDGIFDTVNAALIVEAKRQGYAMGEDAVKAFEADHAPPVRMPLELAKPEEPKKRGRPPKPSKETGATE